MAELTARWHRATRELPQDQWQALLEPGAVLLDLKGIVPRQLQPMRL